MHDPTPREREMRALMRESERSELTLQELADREGIAITTLYWWRSAIRRRDEQRSMPGQEFVEVQVEGSRAAESDSRFEVALQSGRAVRVPLGFDSDELRRLLEVVDSSC